MEADNKKLKILLVDDDRFLLDMYSLKFKNSGLDVDTAINSETALKKLRDGNSYSAILLDIIIPGKDGLEFLKMAKEEKLIKDSLVIILTNQPDEFDKSKSLGADGYILKATTIPSEVVSQVLSICKAKSAR